MTTNDTATEYRAACERVAVFDLSSRGRLLVNGPEAAFFLNNLCTNDVKRLDLHDGCETFLTNAKARVLAHGWVYRLPGDPPAFWLEVSEEQGALVFQHLNRHWVSEQIELNDRTPATAQLHLAGPAAPELLHAVLGGLVQKLEPLRHNHQTLTGVGALEVFRNDKLGLPGFDLVCSVDQIAVLKRMLVDQGATAAGPQSQELLRIEAGMPRFGFELDENRPVFEVGRTKQAICYTKGCYLGQEPIVMARDRGHVNRTLLGLKLGQHPPAPQGAKIFHNSQEIGQVTSSAVSPRLGQAVALAYLRRGSQEPGTTVEVDAEGEHRPAQVAALPLVS